MILEYHRPKTLDEALALLKRQQPATRPLAGGTAIHQLHQENYAVVDLQDLGLDAVKQRGSTLVLGAMLTLQAFLSSLEALNLPGLNLANALGDAIRQEAPLNIRNMATLGGMLVAASGHSPLATALLACDCELLLQPGEQRLALGDWLPVRSGASAGSLIVEVRIPTNVSLAYAAVARTPADFPIVCAAAAGWPSGRRRVTLGGYGPAPRLVIDGADADTVRPDADTVRPAAGAGLAARSAYFSAGDEWASAEYRSEVAGILVERCINSIGDSL